MRRYPFAFLFLGLLATFAAEPALRAIRPEGNLAQLAFTVILVLGVWSLQRERRWFRVGLLLMGLGVATSAAYGWSGSDTARLANAFIVVLFCALSTVLTADQVLLRAGPITLNRIMGALCVYLLLGVLWSLGFSLTEYLLPDAFTHSAGTPDDAGSAYLYYSFVTLTTLGYGDVTPVHPAARTLAYLEAVIGQLYLAVLVASLVGRYGKLALEPEPES
jgi:hypothetical protein